MSLKRIIIIIILLLIVLLLFKNILLIILIGFIILFLNRMKKFVSIYREWARIRIEIFLISLGAFITSLLLRPNNVTARLFALFVEVVALSISPFYPSPSVALSLLGLAIETPTGGPLRVSLLIVASITGYLLGSMLDRAEITKLNIGSLDIKDIIKKINNYNIIIKDRKNFYFVSRGNGGRRDFDGPILVWLPKENLSYSCRSLNCLPTSLRLATAEETLGEDLYLLFPELKEIKSPLVVYAERSIGRSLLRYSSKVYVLSNGQANITVNIFEIPLEKKIKIIIDILEYFYGIKDKEMPGLLYDFFTTGRAAFDNPNMSIFFDLIRGLDRWSDVPEIVELGQDPRSVLAAFALYIKYGGMVVTSSGGIFELLRRNDVRVVLVTNRKYDKASSFIVLAPVPAPELAGPFSKFVDKLSDGEYVGIVEGVPVHGFLKE